MSHVNAGYVDLLISPFSSIGSPITFIIRPSVALPIGT
jgi:hypothetical protein